MNKYHINIDDPQTITSIEEVDPGQEVVVHNDLWKLDQIELPDDLVERWREASNELSEIEHEIFILEKRQMPAIEQAQRKWMDENE